MFEFLVFLVAVGASAGVVFLWIRRRALELKHRALEARFAGVLDPEEDARKARADLLGVRAAIEGAESAAAERRASLQAAYTHAKALHDRLKADVDLLEGNLEDISFGVYRPHYDFDTSEKYKAALKRLSERQRGAVRDGSAVHYLAEWTVGGSRRDGERMQKQYAKLLLRAFNGEVDACVAKVKWNNVTRMEARIEKAFAAINKLGGVMQIELTWSYHKLRLEELRLRHEMAEKKQAEAEEQRAIRAQMRDEERAQREIEKARKQAEDEEARHARALEAARAEIASADGAERDALSERIEKLQAQLDEAHSDTVRAISRAQMTRAGFVYVVSNVGSFGDGILKIGMTRRLKPMDRVKELGDASVPFGFDVHGMMFSEDAPGLEAALHREFDDRRVNLVNRRKEYFRVTTDEIGVALEKRGVPFELTLLAEAQEYRETLALRDAAVPATGADAAPTGGEFPADPFQADG